MISRIDRLVLAAILIAATTLALAAPVLAQDEVFDTRTQYPAVLKNSYLSVDVGLISQPFSQTQLGSGLQAVSISVPRIDVRLVLAGHEFNRYVSVQGHYMRPVNYVTYTDVGPGDRSSHHVRVNFGGATLKVRMPLDDHASLYGEGGIGFASRTGFNVGSIPAISDAHYVTYVAGAGAEYQLNPSWSLRAGLTFTPGKGSFNEPDTWFTSGGFTYTIRPRPAAVVRANRSSETGYIFPAQIVSFEYSSGTGYAINNFFSRTVPIFWGGSAKIGFGFAPHYEQNFFHAHKVFALDAGVSAGLYRTRTNHDLFYTLSVYPVFRFTFIRTRPADIYFAYSFAGPTYISKIILDGLDTGRRFTFQDFMGFGMFLGRERNVNLGVKINHFSNGNIFTQNAAVEIPLTVTLGYAF